MNILYVAPRFHTNQVPIVKGWLDSGDNVKVLCQYCMQTEDYTVLRPIILGYSNAFALFLKIYQRINRKKIMKAQIPTHFNAQFGFPPMRKVKKIINEFHPDVIIYRDRSIYNLMIYRYCHRKKIKGILYNQTPYWENEAEKKDIFHCLVRRLGPQVRMTPVLGKEKDGLKVAKEVYYVPFVIEPCLGNVDEKRYFLNGRIRILCVGKYEERKHHIELLKAIYELPCRSETELIFVGECSRTLHEAYMMQLMNCAQKYGMTEQVQILSNLSLEEVYSEYKKADLFVLPSTGEFASISQLEAMSCALPVICSDTNGTADCVEEGINGFLFQDNNFLDLKKKLEFALNDRNALKNMGKASYEMVLKKYGFENYKKSILKILEDAE